MSNVDVTVALFGDCATQMAAETYKHTRAFGLTNWLSIVSPTTNNFQRLTEKHLEELPLSNYWKRICLLNSRKKILEYLLEEKADYLIIDGNDCRKELIYDEEAPDGVQACITDNWFMPGFNDFVKVMFGEQGRAKRVPGTAINKAEYEKAVAFICDEIKKVYQTDHIVIHKHQYVESYIDETGVHRYIRDGLDYNDATIELIKYIESLLEKNLKGCHIIEFPDNVLGDKKHYLGFSPLHYHYLYYEYVREALDVIFRKASEEKIILRQLKYNYSMQFKIMKMEKIYEGKIKKLENEMDAMVTLGKWENSLIKADDISRILHKQNNMPAYLDALYMLRDKLIIIMATKDTSGLYEDDMILGNLKRLGFTNYPAKLWWMYAGVLFRGIPLVNISSSRAEEPVNVEQVLGHSKISLKAESWRRGNCSVIEINGIDLSPNRRGINMVVCDAFSGSVLDVVSYDSHIMDWFYRK